MSSRPFDLLLWGATGFTGELVLAYLSANYASQYKIAIGGRNESKLQQVLQRAAGANASKFSVLVGDISDRQSLVQVLSQCRVVLSTAGPYSILGTPIIDACIQAKTDYCDITGESTWVKSIQDEYDAAARKAGVLLLNCTGFDSMPADLCCYLGVKKLRELGAEPGDVDSYVKVRGTFSGGTIQTIFTLAERGAKGGNSRFLLNSKNYQDSHKAMNRDHDRDQLLPRSKAGIGYSIPFIMSVVNTRIVRKSAEQVLFEDEKGEKKSLYGDSFSYNESSVIGNGGFVSAFIGWLFLAMFATVLAFKPLRKLARPFLPQPGQGATKEQRAKSRFLYTTFARPVNPSQPTVKVTMSGGDAGYDETAKMITEAGLTILNHKSQLPEEARSGIRTVASLGQFLVDRINTNTETLKLEVSTLQPGQPEQLDSLTGKRE